MQLIKLNATPSTNTYLKQMALEKGLEDFTVVVSASQTHGRGQKGNLWVSDKGKNLTVSILKKFDALDVNFGFGLNGLVSLALYDTLENLSIPQIKVKWPNDIMSGNKKICGILIENTLKGHFIKQSIIGFGLNVNQTFFKDLPQATSLKSISGIDYDLDELLELVLKHMGYYLGGISKINFDRIKKMYEAVMFRKDVRSHFARSDGQAFAGIIRGVTQAGSLIIERENGQLEYFGFKEVKFIL